MYFYVGKKVIVCYDASPIYPYTEYSGHVTKITPMYIRVVDTEGRDELFDKRTLRARGWNTLWLKAE